MTARLLDGAATAATIRAEVAAEVVELKAKGITPGLTVILVGDDPASEIYVRSKARACTEAGMRSDVVLLPATTSQDALFAEVDRLNADPAVHGILCQLPLPAHINTSALLQRIDPAKDVDGFHPVNVGKLVVGDPTGFKPATPFGVQELLVRSGVKIPGARVVIVGRSNLVGRPLANLLSQPGSRGDATVTLAHSRTTDLDAVCREADVLVVAIGRPAFISAAAIKPGATVVDVGTTRVEDASRPRGYRLAGDVDFEGARLVAGAITPVPGGVGPMTIAMLLANTVEAATRSVRVR